MKFNYLQNNDNPTVLLFFNGWGVDENAVRHVTSDGIDVVEIHDYTTLETGIPGLDTYKQVYLVAWSLGVWAASWWMKASGVVPSKTIAINGTMYPIHNQKGIPADLFQGTIDNWNDRGRQRFMSRMFASASLFASHKDKMPNRGCEEQKNELERLQSSICTIDGVAWDKAYIGKDDLIFSAQNQRAAWDGKTEIVELDIPHFPFIRITNWNQLL